MANADGFSDDEPLPRGARDARGRFLKDAPSANPNGARPKIARPQSLTYSADPAADLVMRLARLPAARRGDGTIVDRYEKALEELYRRAVDQEKPDTRALLEYIRITTAATAIEQKYLRDVFANALAYKDYWGPRFEAAARTGQRAPSVLPHPDDVVIHPDATVSIVGPTDRQEQKGVEAVLIMQGHALDAIEIANQVEGDDEPLRQAKRFLHRRLAKFDQALPPRLRRSAAEVMSVRRSRRPSS